MPVGCHAQLGSWQMTFGHGAGSDSKGIQGTCLYLGRFGSQLALHQTQATIEVPAVILYIESPLLSELVMDLANLVLPIVCFVGTSAIHIHMLSVNRGRLGSSVYKYEYYYYYYLTFTEHIVFSKYYTWAHHTLDTLGH